MARLTGDAISNAGQVRLEPSQLKGNYRRGGSSLRNALLRGDCATRIRAAQPPKRTQDAARRPYPKLAPLPRPAQLPACPQPSQLRPSLLTPSLAQTWCFPCTSRLRLAQGRCSTGAMGLALPAKSVASTHRAGLHCPGAIPPSVSADACQLHWPKRVTNMP